MSGLMNWDVSDMARLRHKPDVLNRMCWCVVSLEDTVLPNFHWRNKNAIKNAFSLEHFERSQQLCWNTSTILL